MSIGNIASSGGLPQGLSALLAQFSPTQSTAGVTADNDGDFDNSSPAVSKPGAFASSNSLTGGNKAAISDQVLALFTKLRQHSDSEADSGPTLNPSNTGSPSVSKLSTAIQAFQTANNALSTADSGRALLNQLDQTAAHTAYATNLMA